MGVIVQKTSRIKGLTYMEFAKLVENDNYFLLFFDYIQLTLYLTMLSLQFMDELHFLLLPN